MRDEVSPAHVLRAVDVQLLEFMNVTLGGIEAAERFAPELNRADGAKPRTISAPFTAT